MEGRGQVRKDRRGRYSTNIAIMEKIKERHAVAKEEEGKGEVKMCESNNTN